MLNKPPERGDVLDDRIDRTTSPLSAKLADNAILLECSRVLGNGARVPLPFDWDLKIHRGALGNGSVAFFPGVLVALRGRNGGGGYFQVSEVLMPPVLPPAPSVTSEANSAFSMFIASGPYTPDTDLGFRPWRSMITKIQKTKPAVVLLLGPFIDALHPQIKSGEVDSPPLNLFRTRIIDPQRAYLDLVPGSIAILVPSVRDLLSDHAVFPQTVTCRIPTEYGSAFIKTVYTTTALNPSFTSTGAYVVSDVARAVKKRDCRRSLSAS
ncbi:hypothetical protein B0H16DRAFT_1711208 [Mycena metata]|uniref:DNA polymerase alpha subunit B n=1 Tax=Mycena metata TaxID=1033252 RepID=A0AAD7K7J6_9AGAR|nr:hypothetical protein B0H16DRAFT_1711208 [Mycena metata]